MTISVCSLFVTQYDAYVILLCSPDQNTDREHLDDTIQSLVQPYRSSMDHQYRTTFCALKDAHRS